MNENTVAGVRVKVKARTEVRTCPSCGYIFMNLEQVCEGVWEPHKWEHCPRCKCHLCMFPSDLPDRNIETEELFPLTIQEKLNELEGIDREICLPEVLPCIDARIEELRREEQRSQYIRQQWASKHLAKSYVQ
jgi:hypothetical protein